MRSMDACQNDEWSIVTWRKGEGESPKAQPFRCRSWRHEGACRDLCGACDFARVAQALSEHSHWTYLVLTYPAREWPNKAELFRFGVTHWARLRKRYIREFGPMLYIQTWEVHKSGYPHVNVVVSNEELHVRATADHLRLRKDFLDPASHAVGFGFTKWCEPLRNSQAMAGYITKLGLELTGAHHKNQVPVNAPKHFRRIRASKGLLPKRFKDDTITGQLFKLSYDAIMRQMDGPNVEPDDEAADLLPPVKESS